MRRLPCHCRRPRRLRLRYAAVVCRGQGGDHARRAWHRRQAASVAARLHCRTGVAVRLLRARHLDERGGAVEAEPAPERDGGAQRARPQPLPLRVAQPDGAGGAARRTGNGRAMSTSPTLPVSLAANPRLSSWIRFAADGEVTVSPGKVEIGQGIVTALAQIAADELDIDIVRVRMVRASTAASPNEGVTSGSLSIQQSGRALRHACAEIRQIYLAAASERLGVETGVLQIEDGTILGPGNVRTSYWELADDGSLDRDATPGVVAKPIAQRALAGQSTQRIDIPDKVFGHRRFIHDA